MNKKTFHVFNSETGSWGFYQNIDLVVIADDASSAIEMAKHHYPDYRKDLWKAEECDGDVTYISSSCS